VREAIVDEIGDSLYAACPTVSAEDCERVATAILDGKIARVSVNTAEMAEV
jgi:hypothetical protein